PELKLHGDAGDYAKEKCNAEDLAPESRSFIPAFVFLPDRKRFEDHDHNGQTHRQLRKEIVIGERECELNAVERVGVHSVSSRKSWQLPKDPIEKKQYISNR